MPRPPGYPCSHRGWLRLVAAAGTCVPLALARGAPDTLYWTDRGDGTISRANLDGSGVETLITGLPGPQGVAIDPVNAHIYWADSTLQTIQRANLDGSDVQTVLDAAGAFIPVGLAIDAGARQMYWTDPVFTRIQRAGLDGTGLEDFKTGVASIQDVAVDALLGRVYWTAGSTGIQHAPAAGGPTVTLIAPFTGSATVLAQAPLPCQVVWRAANRLTRADCLGLGTEDLVLAPGNVVGLAVHPETGALFWTDSDTGAIRRLDEGDPIDQVILSGLTMPWRLALGPATVAPVITSQPQSVVLDALDAGVFTVEAVGAQPLSYAWRRDGIPLTDGPGVSGSGAPTLTIIASHAETGLYDCLVSNADGAASTLPAALGVRFCSTAGDPPAALPGETACFADLDGDCDADIFDFAMFSSAFGATVEPGAPGDLDCDGMISVFDFTLFSAQFGCGQAAP